MSRPDAGTHPSLDDLTTEARNPSGTELDLLTTDELVELMCAEDATVPAAVAAAAPAIAAAIDEIATRLRGGGRLVYVGAGTSGRLAALDAAECRSTFSTPPDQVVALLAGGESASPTDQEAAEDDRDAGSAAIRARAVGADDVVVGISASGRTPYVLAALETARAAGALTVAVVSVGESALGRLVDHEITTVVGAEVLAGSTRLKAGTAQKLVLNMLSTIVMVRLGKTYENLMVDVYATNEKLHGRVRRIVREVTGADEAQVDEALDRADGDAKVAIIVLACRVDVETARARLEAADGVVRTALEA